MLPRNRCFLLLVSLASWISPAAGQEMHCANPVHFENENTRGILEERVTHLATGKSGVDVKNRNATIGNDDSLIFDLTQSVQISATMDVYIYFRTADTIHAVDFALRYNQLKVEFDSILVLDPFLQYLYYYNPLDSTLRFTSNNLNPMCADSNLVVIRFNVITGPLFSVDLYGIESYLNGDLCSHRVTDCILSGPGGETQPFRNTVYPDPVHHYLFVSSGDPGKVTITNSGGQIMKSWWHTGTTLPVSINDLSDGVYFLSFQTPYGNQSQKIIVVH